MHNYPKEFEQLIQKVFTALGKKLKAGKDYEIIDRGVPHEPVKLPEGKMAIYTFSYKDKFLKIGKASLNVRFVYQHYGPKRSTSTLAASLLKYAKMKHLNDENVGKWIKKNCRRIDIIIDVKLGFFTLGLIEAILHSMALSMQVVDF